MTEREMVIQGLKTHTDVHAHCEECPYVPLENCQYVLIEDAWKLLKEQENEYENGFNNCLALLKEQEAEPQTVLFRDDGEYCPHCSTITSRAMGVQKLHRGTRFCPYCGKAVTWNG